MMKYMFASAGALLLLAGVLACKKNGNDAVTPPVPGGGAVIAVVPVVTTDTVTRITTAEVSVRSKLVSREGSALKERGICWDTLPAPTIEKNKATAASVEGSGAFVSTGTGLKASTIYYVRAYAINGTGVGYGKEIKFSSADIQLATMTIAPMYIIGSTVASFDVDIRTDGGAPIKERGICWSTAERPTIKDAKVIDAGIGTGPFRGNLAGLSEKTAYHFRAYATNSAGGTSYSPDSVFTTIAKGKLTCTFNKSANPTAEELAAYARMQASFDQAVYYMENYTSYVKHVYLNYSPGTPTADANNEGWMRFGSNASYQNLRTMLHELAHTVGSGTTSAWSNQFIIGGIYQKPRAAALLKLITNDKNAVLKGDSQHYWPYGLNADSEGTTHWDFVYHSLIVQGFKVDGLPNQ
jgi:hypothetical protein